MQHIQLKLRRTEHADLALLFQFQLDEEAMYLAAFTPKKNKAATSTKIVIGFRNANRINPIFKYYMINENSYTKN